MTRPSSSMRDRGSRRRCNRARGGSPPRGPGQRLHHVVEPEGERREHGEQQRTETSRRHRSPIASPCSAEECGEARVERALRVHDQLAGFAHRAAPAARARHVVRALAHDAPARRAPSAASPQRMHHRQVDGRSSPMKAHGVGCDARARASSSLNDGELVADALEQRARCRGSRTRSLDARARCGW